MKVWYLERRTQLWFVCRTCTAWLCTRQTLFSWILYRLIAGHLYLALGICWLWTQFTESLVNAGPSLKFKVLSYNLLAQYLLECHPYLYTNCSPHDLKWQARASRLFDEITSLSPDVGSFFIMLSQSRWSLFAIRNNVNVPCFRYYVFKKYNRHI